MTQIIHSKTKSSESPSSVLYLCVAHNLKLKLRNTNMPLKPAMKTMSFSTMCVKATTDLIAKIAIQCTKVIIGENRGLLNQCAWKNTTISTLALECVSLTQ